MQINTFQPTPPKKPPRRNLSASPTHLMSASMDGDMMLHSGSPRSTAYEYMFLARTGSDNSAEHPMQNGFRGGVGGTSGDSENGEGIGNHYGSKGRAASVDQYVHMSLTHPQPAPRMLVGTAMSTDQQIRSYNPNRKLRRNRENYDVFTLE